MILRLVAAGVALLATVGSARPLAAATEGVLLTKVDGPITPVVADQLAEAVARSEEGGYQLLVVEIDTPGGLDVSMREIVQSFFAARVPVVAYVSPQGARAASAGTMITMAAHVAAMAPGTTIGAATPVDLGGGEITDKIINDAASFAVSIAERRGRDARFAEDAVREGRSVTGEEALEIGVIDLVAEDRGDLLGKLDGRAVALDGQSVILRTGGAVVELYELSLRQRALAFLADPNLAFLFISIGTLAVIYELANPGIGLGGAVGAILLILGFFALSVLPVNVAGLALLLLAAGLFVAELFVPGVGVLAAGGTLALILAGLFLFEGVGVSPAMLWPTAIVVGAGSVVAGRLALRARRRPVEVGTETLVGRRVELAKAAGRTGRVMLDGAWWSVRSREPNLSEGQAVRVVAVEGLELVVEVEES
jgi:membrane-bound serine protease (ClpP class)